MRRLKRLLPSFDTLFSEEKMRKISPTYLLLPLIVLLFAMGVHAQCPGFAFSRLDVNEVNVQINSRPEQYLNYWNGGGYSTEFEVPNGSGKHPILASSFWMGGLDPSNQLHLAASTYGELGAECYCGPYRSSGNYACGQNYDTPVSCFSDGILWLSSGKLMNFYLRGYQVYDPQTLTIVQGVLPNHYENLKAIELANGKVMLIMWRNSLATASEVMVIDSSTFAVPTPDTLLYCQRFATMTLMPNGNVLVVGPFGTEEYNPTTGADIGKAQTLVPRQKHAAMLLPNGLLMVAGGSSLGIELYDPTNNTWTAGPNMGNARNTFPKITPRPSGDILITGGNSSITATDVYNPTTNTVVPGPLVPVGFRAHFISMINNTQAVIVPDPANSIPGTIFVMDVFTGANHKVPLMATDLPAAFKSGQLVISNDTSTHFIFLDMLTERVLGNRWQHVWDVRKTQIAQFQQDFANNTVNFANYRDIELWPGNGSAALGEDAQLAPYIDVDLDGVYDPANDGDYPCFPGDQGLWWVYNDDGQHHHTGGASFPMQVEALAYAFDCSQTPCPDTAIDYATMYHFEITNKAQLDYHDVYFGNFVDFDLGDYTDDYVASDSALGLSICYNADNADMGPGGYGILPPAMGYLCLPNGQIDQMGGSQTIEATFGSVALLGNAPDYYNYLTSRWLDGSHLVNNGLDGHNATAAGPPTNFMYSGNPGWCGAGTGDGGWTEFSAGNPANDRRQLQNFGPFNLAAGASIDLDFAILYSRATTGDNLTSVCKLRNDASFLKDWWVNTMDRNCLNINNPITPRKATSNFKLVPNPNAGLFSVQIGAAELQDSPVELWNLQGQKVMQRTLPAGQTTLQINGSELPKGIYLVRVMRPSGYSTERVVID
jgi:hypothetical protein